MKYYYKRFDEKFMKVSINKDGEVLDAEMITEEEYKMETKNKKMVYEKIKSKTHALQGASQ